MDKEQNIVTVDQEPQKDVAPTPTNAQEVRTKLAEYGIEAEVINKVIDDLGTETMSDLMALTVEDFIEAGVKVAKARRMVKELKESARQPESGPTPAENRTMAQGQLEALLPQVPNDDSWLSALKTGGILKVDESSYIAAIRAALADKVGLYSIPDSLSRAMEAYADQTDEQVPAEFYALRQSLTMRTYGDIFSAIPGLNGNFITEKRRREFLSRVRDVLWPAIAEAYQALNGWYQTYRTTIADPSILLTTLSSALNGGGGVGAVAPPDVAPLHDAGDTLIASINRAFRGTGVQVAAAMAYDASTIRKTLEESQLPAMVGVRNREEMLRKINANVSSNYVRLEQNLTKFVLGFVRHNNVTSDIEISYFVALWQLGNQIGWAELLDGKGIGVTGLTGNPVL